MGLMFFFLIFIIIFTLLFLSYKIYFILSIISFLSGNNYMGIFLLIISLIKFKNRKRAKTEFRFYTNNDFFNQYGNNNYYNQNSTHQVSENEYEKACKFFGFDKDTSFAEKKKIYRAMAKQYHPDLNKDSGAEEMSKKINENWDIIEKYNK